MGEESAVRINFVDYGSIPKLGIEKVSIISPEVNILILYGPPESLDKDVVPPRAFAVHTDLDVISEDRQTPGR